MFYLLEDEYILEVKSAGYKKKLPQPRIYSK